MKNIDRLIAALEGLQSVEIQEIPNQNPIDAMCNAMVKMATAKGNLMDYEMYQQFIQSTERFHATMITLFVCETIQRHKGHVEEDCGDCKKTMSQIPAYIEVCKIDFAKNLDGHIKLNLKANDLVMPGVELTLNEKTRDSIKKDMGIE